MAKITAVRKPHCVALMVGEEVLSLYQNENDKVVVFHNEGEFNAKEVAVKFVKDKENAKAIRDYYAEKFDLDEDQIAKSKILVLGISEAFGEHEIVKVVTGRIKLTSVF